MEDGGWGFRNLELGTWNLELHTHPRFQILLKTFLRLEVFGDDHNRATGGNCLQQHREKGLGCRSDVGAGQCAARLQTPGEGLPGGSLRDVSEHAAGR